MRTKQLQSICSFATNHGYKAVIKDNKVMVKDDDGQILVDNIQDLKEWLGY